MSSKTPQDYAAEANYKSLVGANPTQDVIIAERTDKIGLGISGMKQAADKSTRTIEPDEKPIIFVALSYGEGQPNLELTWWQKMLGHSAPLPDKTIKYLRGISFSDDSHYCYPKMCNPKDQIAHTYPLFEYEGDYIPIGSEVQVEYFIKDRRFIGMCGNNVPAGKVVSVLNKASGDVNDLCALLARNCKPSRPAASGSASKSVKDACNNSRLPFEKPLPYQKPTPVNTQRGEVRPTHPLTGQKLPDDVMMPTSPAEYKKVQKLLGINSIMQRGRVIRGKRSNHKGVDFPFGGKPTLPIKAILKGRVLQVGHQRDSDGKSSGWGRFIVLDHRPFYSLVDEQNNTEISGPLFTIYAHLEKATVRSNMTVDAGQQIAIGGNSGTSTGPHLHLEVLTDATINGSPRVDPLKFFTFKLKKKSSQ